MDRKPRIVYYTSDIDTASIEDVFESLDCRGYSASSLRKMTEAQARAELRKSFEAETAYCKAHNI